MGSKACGWEKWIPPLQVVGLVLAVVAVLSYGGFYIASHRARVAIASSFLLTSLIMLAFLLTVPAFDDASQTKDQMSAQTYAHQLMGDFRNIVMTVIIAYFGSEAAVGTTKVIASRNARPEEVKAVQRADRDLVPRSEKKQ
ncbi:hypothetical protein [Streptomyces sp. TLI_185]|uniref:hypothetical protein n=1 Tax=Streptomyces sp. TLI_185 TaxID=2485151 RepID=UPI000F4DE0D4|nr:hypothetical protein [Streptomyces sp. TLI_185]RPF30378.1 hypothetical protein EDD92_0137 [Streptomyces sp. TLI_185]